MMDVHEIHGGRFSLAGRRALVTGAARGLGLAIARGLAEAGATVWLIGRDPATRETAIRDLRADRLDAHAAAFDVTDGSAAADWFGRQAAPVDILVNNATARDRRPTETLWPAEVRDLFAVNALAAYGLTRAALPGMRAAGGGSVVNLTSIAGPRAGDGDAGYTLAKGALEDLTRSHAGEFGRHGIRVNAIAPSFFVTKTNARWVDDPAVTVRLEARAPLARWGRTVEIAGAAVLLCLPAASSVTGHVLVVDGRLSIRI